MLPLVVATQIIDFGQAIFDWRLSNSHGLIHFIIQLGRLARGNSKRTIAGPMENLIYVSGSVSKPKSIGPQIIGHICNDVGSWCGRNAREITRGWPEAERAYNHWFRGRFRNDFGLGSVQFVNVNKTHVNRLVRVANIIGQRGTRHRGGVRPIRYKTLAYCLAHVAKRARKMGASIHLPQLGMNGSKEHWPIVLGIVKDSIGKFRVPVYIYMTPQDTTEQMFAKVINPPQRKRFELIDCIVNRKRDG